MLNETILIGYISSEVNFTGKDDTMYCKFNIAVPRDYKLEDGTRPADFIPCVAFGTTAEMLYTHFIKGDKVCVKGRMESSKYEKDGKEHYSLALNIKKWYFEKTKPKNLSDYAAVFSKGSEE